MRPSYLRRFAVLPLVFVLTGSMLAGCSETPAFEDRGGEGGDSNVRTDDPDDTPLDGIDGGPSGGGPSGTGGVPSNIMGCGDGDLDDGEECDDANPDDGDGCSEDCEVENGFSCPVVGLPCEECGNGVKESTEGCDDGDRTNGDGCSSSCEIEGTYFCPVPGQPCNDCGNGEVEGLEICDDADDVDDNGCSNDCGLIGRGFNCDPDGGQCELCGNGTVGFGEACDDGNQYSLDGCSFNCLTIETDYTCDPDGGPNSCKLCGNGRLEWDEVCDDGNSEGGDGCSADCSDQELGYICAVPGRACYACGNGVQEGLLGVGEGCDDGGLCTGDDTTRCTTDAECAAGPGGSCTARDGDGCSAICAVETDEPWECPVPGQPCVHCGNGNVEVGSVIGEQCDDGLSCEDGSSCTSASDCDACVTAGDCATNLCDSRSGDGCSSACQLEIGASCDAATPQNCVLCGDGVIQSANAEGCDDGNRFDKDGCTASCQVETDLPWQCPTGEGNGGQCSICGNGRVEEGEECDDRNAVAADGCTSCAVDDGWVCGFVGTQTRSTCDRCGNGIAKLDEECDDGNLTNGDGCTSCVVDDGWVCPVGVSVACNACGNGELEGIERCDDGLSCASGARCDGVTPCADASACQARGGDGCSATCDAVEDGFRCPTPGVRCLECGNGVRESGETCDDGNATSGDGCRADCKAVETGWLCDTSADPTLCDRCPNGQVDTGIPGLVDEQCDDGNQNSADGCTTACQVQAGWTCVPGPNGRSVCDRCGNGVVGGTEDCDDGDTSSGDGCDASCDVEPGFECPPAGGSCFNCGDGIVQPGEVCDAGATNGQGCALDCSSVATHWACPAAGQPCEQCGDGDVGLGEVCDDGLTSSGDGCRGDCKVVEPGWLCNTSAEPTVCSQCGNGQDDGEACDDGNRVSGDGCSAVCALEGPTYDCSVFGQACERCGNRLRESREQCDDGNASGGDGCSADCKAVDPNYTCTIPGIACNDCGNGVLEGVETCDDDNAVSGDGCTNCRLEPGYTCTGTACSATRCGDGAVAGNEECDDGDNLSADGCSAACKVESGFVCPETGGNCVANECGDTFLGGSEQCDDGNLTAGDGCNATCKIETTCGDGIVGGTEACDNAGRCTGNNTTYCTTTADCASAGGTCTVRTGDGCNASCAFEAGAACTGAGATFSCVTTTDTCGNGIRGNSEACDDGDSTSGDGCSSTCTVETTSFYECAGAVGQLSVCEKAIQFVAIRRFILSEVQPDAMLWDPATRSFVAYGNKTKPPIELCLDGTLIYHPGSSKSGICPPGKSPGDAGCTAITASSPIARTYPNGGSTNVEGGTYDPVTGTWLIQYGGALRRFTSIKNPGNGTSIGTFARDGVAIGEDGRLYAISDSTDRIYAYARPSTSSEFVLTSVANGTGWTVPSAVNIELFTLPGFGMLGTLTSQVLRFWSDDTGTEVASSTMPGELILAQDAYNDPTWNVTTWSSNRVLSAAEVATDGSGFVVCADNPSDPCYLFAQGCEGDADCANLPGTSCRDDGSAPTPYCWAPAQARDDFASVAAPSAAEPEPDVVVEVLDNDTRAENICAGGPLAVDYVGYGGVESATQYGGQVYIGTDAECAGAADTCAVYLPPEDGTCNIIDTFVYEAYLGSSTPLYSATVRVTVACDCGNGVVDQGEECDPGCGSSTQNGCVPAETTKCDAFCALRATCGDGATEGSETCDDGKSCANGAACTTTCGDGSSCRARSGDGCSWDCRTEGCGDGVESPTEECDDGNLFDGDGCRADCTTEICGDGIIDATEQCDDQNGNESDGCLSSCVLGPVCGDGNRGSGEGCDDGDTTSGDGCSSSCVVEYCGDGITNDTNEDCDEGASNGNGTSGCTWDCQSESCGDGVLAESEACDDGDTTSGDGCSSACEVEYCGDGLPGPGEGCDDADADDADGCRANCTVQGCGDFVLDDAGTNVEECDDGNLMPGDGCSEICELEAFCGNGVVEAGEECDYQDPSGTEPCSLSCTVEVCGNGVVEFGEDCDEGILNADDGECRLDCSVPRCGDAVEDPQLGEQCDDGAFVNGDGCNQFCLREAACGNGLVDPGEECDFGSFCANGTTACDDAADCIGTVGNDDTCAPRDGDADGCSASCTFEGCGNGIKEASEQCDPTAPSAPAGCRPNCTLAACGDGVFDPGEECDLGAQNGVAMSGCTLLCKVTTVCGNSTREGSEQCDDGDTSSGDGCSSLCRFEYCGNGFEDPGEECDDGDNVSGDGCSSTCREEAVCGDGDPESPEQCDEGSDNGDSGSSCSSDCRLVAYCGDGNVDAGEQCDPGVPGSSGCTVNCTTIIIR